MNADYLAFLAVGRLFIWIVQIFPLTRQPKREFFAELVQCNFCLGCWIYFGLSFAFLPIVDFIPSIPILSNVLIGIVTSFAAYLLYEGWKTIFGTISVTQ
jgi:hypothetical protein